MGLTLTHTDLDGTIKKSELNTNFSDISTKFGNIDNSDIKASAEIAASKLAANKEYVTIVLGHSDYTWADTDGTVIDVQPLPGLSSTQNDWTLKAAAWACTDVGTTAGTFDVVLGYYNSGTFTDETVLINNEEMTIATNNLGNAGQCTLAATSVAYHASRNRVLLLREVGTGDDVAVLTADPQHIRVSLLLERQIQS